jgi:hypothetical protein
MGVVNLQLTIGAALKRSRPAAHAGTAACNEYGVAGELHDLASSSEA